MMLTVIDPVHRWYSHLSHYNHGVDRVFLLDAAAAAASTLRRT